jgi:predicted O-linked N-acetylglucosamine transferase (SPINDLY family)
MGLPVITLYGDLPCGRLSASGISVISRPELIAGPIEAYVATASMGRLEAVSRH